MKTEQRHAQEHWLRLQAEAALGLADDIERDMNIAFVKAAIKDVPVFELQGMMELALQEAARQLVKAEMLHREIVRRGGTV